MASPVRRVTSAAVGSDLIYRGTPFQPSLGPLGKAAPRPRTRLNVKKLSRIARGLLPFDFKFGAGCGPGLSLPLELCYRRSHMTLRLRLLAGFAIALRLVPGQSSESGPQPKTTREDLAEGQRIFGTQCAYCHGPKGEGGQGAVLAVPRLSHAPDDQTLGFLQIRVATKDGKNFTGVRINEDTFSIQMRDLSDRLHSFWKNELTEIVKEPKQSLMPIYRNTLTTDELDDLVAYLLSLRSFK